MALLCQQPDHRPHLVALELGADPRRPAAPLRRVAPGSAAALRQRALPRPTRPGDHHPAPRRHVQVEPAQHVRRRHTRPAAHGPADPVPLGSSAGRHWSHAPAPGVQQLLHPPERSPHPDRELRRDRDPTQHIGQRQRRQHQHGEHRRRDVRPLPSTSPAMLAPPTHSTSSALPSPVLQADRRSAAASRASRRANSASTSSTALNATTSAAVSNVSVAAAATSPRAPAIVRSARRAAAAVSQGTTVQATSTASATAPPATGSSSTSNATVAVAVTMRPPPAAPPAATGRAPHRHPAPAEPAGPHSAASSPAGASCSSRPVTRARVSPSTRYAASCPASRSTYRNTPRPTPNARTATIATINVSTGGCAAAFVINQAEVASNATADPDANTPRSTASTNRPTTRPHHPTPTAAAIPPVLQRCCSYRHQLSRATALLGQLRR